MAVKNRIKKLIRDKGSREDRDIPVEEVATAVGMTRQGFYRWLRDDVENYNKVTLDRLCRYFQCQPGDILYFEDDEVIRETA